MEGEEIQIVFFYKLILFEYNDSTTLLQNVGVISSVVSHESAQKKKRQNKCFTLLKTLSFYTHRHQSEFLFLNLHERNKSINSEDNSDIQKNNLYLPLRMLSNITCSTLPYKIKKKHINKLP